jgi:ABC-type sugar transport system permease subunit
MTGKYLTGSGTGFLKRMTGEKRKESTSGYLFMMPFLGLLFVFVILTFIYGLIVSCSDAQGINPGEFIGLDNYRNVISDPWFWGAIYNTFKFMIACIVTQIPAAIFLAVWLQSIPYKGLRGILQAAFFIPFLMNTVVTALLFRMMFEDPSIVNWVLGVLHLPHSFKWTLDPSLSFPLLALVAFWQGIGFQAIYFHAYLQTIDPSLYEAARIDGATSRQMLFRITVPLIRPAITFMIVTTAIGSLLVFDLVFMLFRYGPGENVVTILIYVYGKAFRGNFEVGVAAAAGWISFFIILAVSLLQIRFLGLGRERED